MHRVASPVFINLVKPELKLQRCLSKIAVFDKIKINLSEIPNSSASHIQIILLLSRFTQKIYDFANSSR